MTGFARTEGTEGGLTWAWELRSVNGRGLDLKLRLPPGFETMEPALREEAGRVLRRGNVSANLVAKRDDRARMAADPVVVDELLRLALDLAARIPGAPAPRAEAMLALPGVLRPAAAADEGVSPAQLAAVRSGYSAALAALVVSRQSEGARLAELLGAQLREVVALRDTAVSEAADQPALQRARMMENLVALLRDQPGLPEERIAQEVARVLLDEATGIGRKFDFLVQEFVREVNTLCSKSASVTLTATGLRLKAVIEQMREQVQNVE
jgi:uncharacterized protein (TIGR00255 family)